MKSLIAVIIGIVIPSMVLRVEAKEEAEVNAFQVWIRDLKFILPEGFTLRSVRSRANHTSLWISNLDRTESFMTVILYTNLDADQVVIALHPAYSLHSCVSSASELVLRKYWDRRAPRAIVTAAGQRALAQFNGPWDIALDAIMELFPEEVWGNIREVGGYNCEEERSDLSYFVKAPEDQ